MWTRLIYGTAVILSLAGGTAIYYITNPADQRDVIHAVDVIELAEGANERLMPFSDRLVMNWVIYQQPIYTNDVSTNRWISGTNAIYARWQDGSNQVPYCYFAGFQAVTDSVVTLNNLMNVYHQGITNHVEFASWKEGDEWVFSDDWDNITSPSKYFYSDFYQNQWHTPTWTIDITHTGRTVVVGRTYGATNEVPAYFFDIHPIGIGAVYTSNPVARVDSIIETLLSPIYPCYVDHEQAVNGVFTNTDLPMLGKSSVWTRLNLQYVWTNVVKSATNVPYAWALTNSAGVVTNLIGTNADWICSTNISTNYTFESSSVVTSNNLTARFKVLRYMRWTKGYGLTWTNSTLTTWTNLLYSPPSLVSNEVSTTVDYYPETIYSEWYMDRPRPTTPDWWDASAEAGPPGEWFTPSHSPLIDDVDVGTTGTTNNGGYGQPRRWFTSDGTFVKGQAFLGQDFQFDEDYSGFWVTNKFSRWNFWEGTNIVFELNAKPAITVPWNVAGIPCTGDVYVAVFRERYYPDFGSNLVERLRLQSAVMTHDGGFRWVGDHTAITNDVFDARTNEFHEIAIPWGPMYLDLLLTNSSWGAQWKVSTRGNIPFGWNPLDWPYSNGHWLNDYSGIDRWDSDKPVHFTEKDVVFKWGFSRCRP
jgi:hypothetical protein